MQFIVFKPINITTTRNVKQRVRKHLRLKKSVGSVTKNRESALSNLRTTTDSMFGVLMTRLRFILKQNLSFSQFSVLY